MRTSFPASPRLRRTAGVLALALAATVLAHRPARAGEVNDAGQRPWLAVFSSVAPVSLSAMEYEHIAFRTIGVQGTGTVRLEIATPGGAVVRTIEAKPGIDLRTGMFRWDGRDDADKRLPNGRYVATLIATDAWGVDRPSAPHGLRLERPTTSRVLFRVNGAGRRMALTFDDCNFDASWRTILDILERRHLLASFFCSGVMVERFPALARRTAAAGHTIGNHAYYHPNLTRISDSNVETEMRRTADAWWTIAGVTPVPYMRPPYGAWTPRVIRDVGQTGYEEFVVWDVDPSDWTKPGASAIAARVLSHVRAGSIVLLHVQPQTAQALPIILAGLNRMDLHPVSLEELLRRGTPVRTR